MRQYVLIENGQIVQEGLPTVGILKYGENAGRTVSGYNLLDEVILIAEGWLPLIDTPPEYNQEIEYLEHAGYSITENEVMANYLVKQREPVVTVPTLEERLAAVEEYLMSL